MIIMTGFLEQIHPAVFRCSHLYVFFLNLLQEAYLFSFLCCLVNYNVIFVPRRSAGGRRGTIEIGTVCSSIRYTNGFRVLTQVSYFQLKSDLDICLHIRRGRSLLILRSQGQGQSG